MAAPIRCPLTAHQVLDMYFLDNRARLLEIAAFFDRIDRCLEPQAAQNDFRYRSFVRSLKLILESAEGRTARVQHLLSDPTSETLERVADPRAYGAWKGSDHEDH